MMLGDLPAMGDDIATLTELNEVYLESVKSNFGGATVKFISGPR